MLKMLLVRDKGDLKADTPIQIFNKEEALKQKDISWVDTMYIQPKTMNDYPDILGFANLSNDIESNYCVIKKQDVY